MINVISEENINFKFIYDFLEDQNVVICSPEMVDKVTEIIKAWIAITMAQHYDKDPKKMIEGKHFFRFIGCSLLNNEIILITKKI